MKSRAFSALIYYASVGIAICIMLLMLAGLTHMMYGPFMGFILGVLGAVYILAFSYQADKAHETIRRHDAAQAVKPPDSQAT